MPEKVKRGLGLLVVAVIAWAISAVLVQIDTNNTAAQLLVGLPLIAAGLVALGCLVGGLVLVAWGLLRD